MKIIYLLRASAVSLAMLGASCTSVDNLSDVNDVTGFTITGHAPQSLEIGDAILDTDNSEIRIPVRYGVENFPLTFSADVTFGGKIDQVVGTDISREMTLTRMDTTLTFTVVALSGMPRTYAIKPVVAEFALPSPIGVRTVAANPAAVVVDPQVTVSGFNLFLSVKNASFPQSITPEFDIDESRFSFHSFVNGETPLVFESPVSKFTITVEDRQTGAKRDVVIGIIQTDIGEVGFEVTSFQATALSSTFTASGITVHPGTAGDSTVDGEILITLENPGSCPLTVSYNMTVSNGATASIPLVGELVFEDLTQVRDFTVSDFQDRTKNWKVRIAEFTPQLKNWQLNDWVQVDWSWASNKYLFPSPRGASGAPYWSNANMSETIIVFPVRVDATTRIPSPGGAEEGYAAQLKTGSTYGKNASGSLFLGWFDTSNVSAGLSDPTVMTHQGIPFAASKKIRGIKVDVAYTSGATATDAGSISVETIRLKDDATAYEYHGDVNGTIHPRNTAVKVARGKVIIGNLNAGQKASTGDVIQQKVDAGQWLKDLEILIDYTGVADQSYTHFLVIASSSSQGNNLDDPNSSVLGSTLVIDNVRIIYED